MWWTVLLVRDKKQSKLIKKNQCMNATSYKNLYLVRDHILNLHRVFQDFFNCSEQCVTYIHTS